jgi:hypothetical protein
MWRIGAVRDINFNRILRRILMWSCRTLRSKKRSTLHRVSSMHKIIMCVIKLFVLRIKWMEGWIKQDYLFAKQGADIGMKSFKRKYYLIKHHISGNINTPC